MGSSLYDRLGGDQVLEKAVDIFYRRILRDMSISHFFLDVDMYQQRTKQRLFLSMVFGGPVQYTGRNLRLAHAPLIEKGMTERHFNAVVGHLKATLEELNVSEDLVREVMEIVSGTREDVLNL